MSGNMVALGDVAQFINGAAFKPEDWGEEGLPIIRIQNLTDPSKPYNRTTRVVADKLYVQSGDLLVSWSATLGVFVWDRDGVGLLNQHIFRVVPDESKVSKPYLRHSLEGALAAMQKHLHGATMQHVNRGEFLATPLYLPPLEEQRRIAAILDQADTLRTQRRAALAQLDSLTQSLFLDMFGDPVTNSKGWPVSQIGNEAKLQGGFAFKSTDYVTNGVKLVKISNVHRDALTWDDVDQLPESYLEAYKSFNLNVSDIVIALTRPIIQSLDSVKIAVVSAVDIPSLLNQRVGRFAFKKAARLEPQYLLGFCRSKAFFNAVKKFCSESLQPNMSTAQVEELEIPLPPLPLQQTFATRIQAIEALKATHRTALTELDALFASLQQRAFAGEL